MLPHELKAFGNLLVTLKEAHLAIQEDTRLPMRLLHCRLPSKASRGRPPKCWTDVWEDLETLRLLLNRSRLAKDRG